MPKFKIGQKVQRIAGDGCRPDQVGEIIEINEETGRARVLWEGYDFTTHLGDTGHKPATRLWIKISSLTAFRTAFRTVLVNGRIYEIIADLSDRYSESYPSKKGLYITEDLGDGRITIEEYDGSGEVDDSHWTKIIDSEFEDLEEIED